MIATAEESAAADTADTDSMLRRLWRRDGWAVVAALLVTIAAELAVYLAVRRSEGPYADALLATLAVMTVLCCLAPAALAAGGRGAMSSLLRGGIVADASGLTLLVLWGLGLGNADADLPFLAVLKIYCMLVAVTLTGVAAVMIPHSPTGRCIAAATTAAVMVAALSSPVWISAWLGTGAELETQQHAAELAVAVNPFYAVTSAGYHARDFVWHQWGVMYRWSRLGEYVAPPPVAWWATMLGYCLAAGVLGGLAGVAGLWRRRRIRPAA